MMNGQALGVYAVDRIAFPQRQIEIAGSVESDCPRTVQRRSCERGAIWRRLPFPCAAERFDRAGRKVYLANTVITNVANEQPSAAWIHSDTVRLAELCASRRSAVS